MSQITKSFLLKFTVLLVIAGSFSACGSNPAITSNNQTSSTIAPASGGEINQNQSSDPINDEKEKLQKEREKLEKEKQELKDEKAKTEKMKDAKPPSSELVDTFMVTDPPTNIRDSPNGKVLCVAKKQELIKSFGSTGISDNNGEWFYTNYCGKMGVIHSSQVVAPS